MSQINQGLSQIDQVTQQNTATAEQTASASEELTSQAATLRNLLTQFRVDESGGTTTYTASSQRPQSLPAGDIDDGREVPELGSDWGKY